MRIQKVVWLLIAKYTFFCMSKLYKRNEAKIGKKIRTTFWGWESQKQRI